MKIFIFICITTLYVISNAQSSLENKIFTATSTQIFTGVDQVGKPCAVTHQQREGWRGLINPTYSIIDSSKNEVARIEIGIGSQTISSKTLTSEFCVGGWNEGPEYKYLYDIEYEHNHALWTNCKGVIVELPLDTRKSWTGSVARIADEIFKQHMISSVSMITRNDEISYAAVRTQVGMYETMSKIYSCKRINFHCAHDRAPGLFCKE